MPNTSNPMAAASVMESPRNNCERVAEADSRKKQAMARPTMQELELNVYAHCYGD